MATRRDRPAEARLLARGTRIAIGAEIRDGRLAAGISQGVAGRAVGMSHAQYGRIERGVLPNVTLAQLCLACTAVGKKLVVRAYPDGEPVRDAAQLALLGRLRSELPPSVGWRTEVPLPRPGDLRAWDAVIRVAGGELAVEAETRLTDIQALERRIGLKMRDSQIDRVILLVNESATNRRVVRTHREDLRAMFPLERREVMAALRSGACPAENGLVLL
jgi:transcriptional regulator with XRE-family HTH domain